VIFSVPRSGFLTIFCRPCADSLTPRCVVFYVFFFFFGSSSSCRCIFVQMAFARVNRVSISGDVIRVRSQIIGDQFGPVVLDDYNLSPKL